MESIEVLPSINLVKFFGEINFERILKMDGKISGFGDIPVEVTSHGSDLNLNVRGFTHLKQPQPNTT